MIYFRKGLREGLPTVVVEEEPGHKKVTNVIRFSSGEESCAWSPGHFCEFIGSVPGSWGSKPMCYLFSVELRDTTEEGWIKRCPECLGLKKEEEKEKGSDG